MANCSPALAEQAITVAASTLIDAKADSSNYGAPVNIWAAGSNTTSTWNDGRTNVLSGTSMATPHISGFDTYLLGPDNTLAPDQIATAISDKALDEILSGFREFFFTPRCVSDDAQVNTARS